MKEQRDRALLAILLACGVRRHEAVNLNLSHIQQREEHWAIADLKGKAGHVRTIPMPVWVKNLLDQWLQTANITSGKLFRRVHKIGKAGSVMPPEANWSKSSFCSVMSQFRQPNDISAASSAFKVRSTTKLEYHRIDRLNLCPTCRQFVHNPTDSSVLINSEPDGSTFSVEG